VRETGESRVGVARQETRRSSELLGVGGEGDWEKDDQVGITRARPGENSIRGHFDVSSRRESSDTRRYDALSTSYEYDRLCSLDSACPPCLLVAVAATAPRHLRAHNLDSFIPLPISRLPLPLPSPSPTPLALASLSGARVSESARAWPQTCTRAGRPVTIPNQKAGVTLAPVPVPSPVPTEYV
jgi:hypothetical protein